MDYLKIIKQMIADGMISQEVAAKYVPELKESEDEKIRKEIIDFLGLPHPQFVGKRDHEKWIAWLEKQGNKSDIGISEATKQKLEDNLNNALEKETPESWNKFLDEQGEQKLMNEKSLYKAGYLDGFENGVRDAIIKEDEQKSAWSEEDDKILKSIIINIENLQFSEDMREKYHHILNTNKSYYQIKIDWLKSLKDRVQPKREWNYNDEIIIGTIIQEIEKIPSEKFIDNAKYRCLDWLRYRTKSLRPQNTWKPSDEQMDALRYVTNFDYGGHKATLVSLYEQLKKLKG